MEVSVHDDGRAGPKSPPTPLLDVRTPRRFGDGTSVRQTSLFQPPPPHAHAHTPPHHCAYAPRHIVHCTPLAHAADRWRSVCTITDAPAQSRLKLRRSHVHPVPRVTPQSAPQCARLENWLSPCASRARLLYFSRAVGVPLTHTSQSPTLPIDEAQCAYDDGEVVVACAGDLARLARLAWLGRFWQKWSQYTKRARDEWVLGFLCFYVVV